MHHQPVRSQRQPPVFLARLGTWRLWKPTDGHSVLCSNLYRQHTFGKDGLLSNSSCNPCKKTNHTCGCFEGVNTKCNKHFSDRSERLITLIHHNVTVMGVVIRNNELLINLKNRPCLRKISHQAQWGPPTKKRILETIEEYSAWN